MKIQILIGVDDADYLDHLSRVLSQRYADEFEVSACSAKERLEKLMSQRRFRIALLSPALVDDTVRKNIELPLLLWDGEQQLPSAAEGLKRLRKYQRISMITRGILEQYAGISGRSSAEKSLLGHITAVWSPAGGSGKTTVAMACAARRVSQGKKTIYLDLEHFSSTKVYFRETGKSISAVFEKLDEDVAVLLRSIQQEDVGSGIWYYCQPANYDDMNILTPEDLAALVGGSGACADELVIDLPSVCDEKVQRLLELADCVLVVADQTPTARAKLEQFLTQHSVYRDIAEKTKLVSNKGARIDGAQVQLPLVQSGDPIVVYKTLSANNF